MAAIESGPRPLPAPTGTPERASAASGGATVRMSHV